MQRCTDTVVLRILIRGDAYGFEIYNRILERTGDQYELKETTLYSSYKRLEAEGCIRSYWGDETQGARRKYYRITDKGREVFERNMRDWKFTQKPVFIFAVAFQILYMAFMGRTGRVGKSGMGN
uniref:Transcriptional regulator, PadR family n=1 Tax=uncultured bacterium contig00088 TaxID=1181561 RepID=A0A806KH78_9BACT|nr:transcriptional regulator, PadR family [uncultured bacterium contig00088]